MGRIFDDRAGSHAPNACKQRHLFHAVGLQIIHRKARRSGIPQQSPCVYEQLIDGRNGKTSARTRLVILENLMRAHVQHGIFLLMCHDDIPLRVERKRKNEIGRQARIARVISDEAARLRVHHLQTAAQCANDDVALGVRFQCPDVVIRKLSLASRGPVGREMTVFVTRKSAVERAKPQRTVFSYRAADDDIAAQARLCSPKPSPTARRRVVNHDAPVVRSTP